MEEIKTVMQEMMMNHSTESESKCEKCGENLFCRIEMLGKIRTLPRLCSCQREAEDQNKQTEKYKENQVRLETLIKNSLMDVAFFEMTFDKWDFSKGSRRMYSIGQRYVQKFKELKSAGIGLLIHGVPGNGKTFLSSCIANELLKQYIPAICVSVNGLLSRIKETYSKYGDEAEADILRSLGRADLLIIDDLGTEKVSDWSRATIYNIIDSRYRSKLPLIITTNLSIDLSKTGVLAELYGRRTEDRILEMCTPIENTGKSIRKEEAKRKTQLLNSLFEVQP